MRAYSTRQKGGDLCASADGRIFADILSHSVNCDGGKKKRADTHHQKNDGDPEASQGMRTREGAKFVVAGRCIHGPNIEASAERPQSW